MSPTPEQRRTARRQFGAVPADAGLRRGPSRGAKKPITVDLILDTAFDIVAREGFEALTMRRVATALETGPSSLYAHVVNKEDLDELLIGRLCAEIDLPEPDPAAWREQIISVCGRLREQYLRFPGISRAALASAPTNTDTLRVGEGMFAILLAGGIEPQTAAWAVDALNLYVTAHSLEVSLVGGDGWVAGRDELMSRLTGLPDSFPNTRRYAAELTSGSTADRFTFTLNLMLDGLNRP
ncbi:TetR/AcrR family transcriptional regulator [Paractinoplanes atraurantiacus]|uniref:DNA-binding transcriptional regulator, AcrR family n=1 Tax=Paractinoplanes atraurantiacus TaxID=1036182 RepID=A0A285KGF6_9ACTN|nr:TetR/AcrR family transcriptional regulator [Actinoplanes atraurantiacus]SNY70391.1 DNA-binding transcriptional regulator, AcrR family [Actinoplanes atraurantiacus]